MTDERRVHEVIVKARNLIEERDWCQGVVEDDRGRVCARGAIGRAMDGRIGTAEEQRIGSLVWSHISEDSWRFRRAVRRHERRLDLYPPGSTVNPLAVWNNMRGRTKVEVLAAFDRAIAATAPPPDTSFLSNPEQSPSLAEEVVAP